MAGNETENFEGYFVSQWDIAKIYEAVGVKNDSELVESSKEFCCCKGIVLNVIGQEVVEWDCL